MEMSLNNNDEDSDHLSKLKEQNGEEYEDAAETFLLMRINPPQ